MKKLLLSIMLYLPLSVYAYDIEVDGIYYSYNQSTQTVSVTYDNTWGSQRYSGNITIPSEITYKGKKIPVTSIASSAFENCSDLLSVSLPNTIISIETQAFKNCTKLSNVVLPRSLKTIKTQAFDNCRNIKKIIIPASVTKVESGAFSFNSRNSTLLSTLYIEDGNDEIEFCSEDAAYISNLDIRNIYIGRPRKTYGGYSSYSDGTINPKVLGIGKNVLLEYFPDVTSLEKIYSKIVEPSSHHVYFSNTVYLNATLYVPKGTKGKYMNSDGWNNFFTIEEMDVNLMWNENTEMEEKEIPLGDGTRETPYNIVGLYRYIEDNIGVEKKTDDIFVTGNVIDGGFSNGSGNITMADKNNEGTRLYFRGNYLNNIPFKNGDTNVEKGDRIVVYGKFVKYSYGRVESLSDAAYLISIENTENTMQKCASPIISYDNGKLKFNSETDGVTYKYTITDSDIKAGSSQEVQLGVTYDISVYAAKPGYDNSETVKATLCWIDVAPKTEGISNSLASVRAMALLVHNSGGQLTINGIDDGTLVTVYNVNGVQVGSATSRNGHTIINTSLPIGSIAIVKIGEKCVKVLMK